MEDQMCEDCKEEKATVTYGLGTKRCKYCSEYFDEMNRSFKQYQACKKHKCDCGALIPLEQSTCQDCCDHEFDADEGYLCLNCGKNGAEDVMSAAYDRAKDIRKYGG